MGERNYNNMRYVIDIENDDTMTLGDEAGLLEIVLDGPSIGIGSVMVGLNELQLDELIHAIDLIKSLRPKKSINIPSVGGAVTYYPPGVRTYTTNVQDCGYEATSHADNPNG